MYTNSYQQNYPYYSQDRRPIRPNFRPNNNRLFGGGFLGPFVLGGITGGLLAPSFYPRPYGYGPPPPPYPYYY